MKNIHVIKTDKTSRLHKYDFDGFALSKEALNWKEAKNIYITSDEEIKEGVNQWYLDKVLNKPRNSSGSQYGENQNVIILTTDQDLIKDGVLAIDDEFLEWFVKNPSFEFVEVTEYLDSGFSYGYKIIIPKEEPKPNSFCETPEEKCTMNYCDENGCQNRKRELVEPKQETLEELKKWREEALIAHEINQKVIKKLMDEKKRMYSEEDLKEAFYQGSSNSEGLEFGKNRFSEWLKIFKNK